MNYKPVIFLAEDDPDDQEFFAEAIDSLDLGIEVVTTQSGDLAIEQLSANPTAPDLIFLDLNMPVLNGLECLRIIRQTDKLEKTPVYIYTTYCSNKHKEEARVLGVTSVIIKPDSIRDLSALLKQIITNRA